MPKPPKRRAKPIKYTAVVAERVLIALAEGQSLRDICRRPDMPAASTVYRWLLADTDLRDRYTAARVWQAEYWAEDIIAIADDTDGDWTERETVKGDMTRVFNKDNVVRAKLRIDARRWLMERLAPKKYSGIGDDPHSAPACDIAIHLDAPEPPADDSAGD